MSLFIFGEFGMGKELTVTLGLFPKGLVIFSWRLFILLVTVEPVYSGRNAQ